MIKHQLILIALAAWLTSCQPAPAPLQVITANGAHQTLDKETLDKHILFLNFWAPWCKPCLQEIPELNAFAANHPEVIVLAVNFDHPSQDTLVKNSHDAGIQYASLVSDPGALFTLPDIPGLPYTLLINDRREIMKTLPGAQSQASLATALAALRPTAAPPHGN